MAPPLQRLRQCSWGLREVPFLPASSSSSSSPPYLLSLPPPAPLLSTMCLLSLLFSTFFPLLTCSQFGGSSATTWSGLPHWIPSAPVPLPLPPKRRGSSYRLIFQTSWVLMNNYAIFSGYLLTAKESKPAVICGKTRQGSSFQASTKEFCWMTSSQQHLQ